MVYILNSTEYALDRIDRKILSALRRNGRLTVAQLAEEVGLSSSPCWTRLKRLESLKIIEGYTVNVNPKAIGIHELFFIEITLERHDDEMLENFSEALADIPEVVEAHLVTGDYDYLVKVAVKMPSITNVFYVKSSTRLKESATRVQPLLYDHLNLPILPI